MVHLRGRRRGRIGVPLVVALSLGGGTIALGAAPAPSEHQLPTPGSATPAVDCNASPQQRACLTHYVRSDPSTAVLAPNASGAPQLRWNPNGRGTKVTLSR